MLKDLVKMASKLDALGLSKEADVIDNLVRKIASREDELQSYMSDSCLLYTSPSPRDRQKSRMPSSA